MIFPVTGSFEVGLKLLIIQAKHLKRIINSRYAVRKIA